VPSLIEVLQETAVGVVEEGSEDVGCGSPGVWEIRGDEYVVVVVVVSATASGALRNSLLGAGAVGVVSNQRAGGL